jgi:hypothetical protein
MITGLSSERLLFVQKSLLEVSGNIENSANHNHKGG